MRRHGLPPLRREFSQRLGLTHASSVDVHLIALQVKAWIERRRDAKRGIRVLAEAGVELPLNDLVEAIGERAAGEPIRAEGRVPA